MSNLHVIPQSKGVHKESKNGTAFRQCRDAYVFSVLMMNCLFNLYGALQPAVDETTVTIKVCKRRN